MLLADPQRSQPRPVLSYLAQLVLVPLAAIICSVPLQYGFTAAARLFSSSALAQDLLGLAAILSTAVLLSFVVLNRWPELERTAMLVWVPPLAFLTMSLARSYLNPFERGDIAELYLSSYGIGEGLTRLLVTDPAAAAVGYSVGAAIARFTRRA